MKSHTSSPRKPIPVTIEIAQELIKKIKREVTSLPDIVPKESLPVTHTAVVLATLGSEILEKVISHRKLDDALTAAMKVQMDKLRKAGAASPITTVMIATALCGTGQCQVTSSYLLSLLMSGDYEFPFFIISVIGNPRRPNPKTYDDYYNHCFVLVGDCSKLSSKSNVHFVEQLKGLSDKVLFIDPWFGVAGKANQIDKLLGGVIAAHGYSKIFTIQYLADEYAREENKKTFAMAERISAEVRQQLGLPDRRQVEEKIIQPAKKMDSQLFCFFDINKKPASIKHPEAEAEAEEKRSLLVSDRQLDWDMVMSRYYP